jgi:hypothetical protein
MILAVQIEMGAGVLSKALRDISYADVRCYLALCSVSKRGWHNIISSPITVVCVILRPQPNAAAQTLSMQPGGVAKEIST